jgi:asparagine N-glycosylation enzyme membrane subunit Stt3
MILAAAGLYLYFARQRAVSLARHSSFLIAWLIIGPIMAYLPLVISRRLIAGWQIPLCIFGAYALLRLIDSQMPLRRTIAVGALALSAISTLVVIGMGIAFVGAPRPPLYQTADQLAALEWLGAHTTDRDVVLSEWRFGNLVPIYADARVFVGHPIETIGYTEKRTAVERFFDPATSEADRQALIDRWDIKLVVAPTDRPAPPRSQIVFQQGPLNIYQITP